MTTKRTIMENEQMSIELSYQSRQTEKLLSRNNVLLEENRQAGRHNAAAMHSALGLRPPAALGGSLLDSQSLSQPSLPRAVI